MLESKQVNLGVEPLPPGGVVELIVDNWDKIGANRWRSQLLSPLAPPCFSKRDPTILGLFFLNQMFFMIYDWDNHKSATANFVDF